MKHRNGKEPPARTQARRTAYKLGVTRRELRHEQEKIVMLRGAFDKFRCRVISVELECDVVAHMLRSMGPLNKSLSARVGEDLARRIERVGRLAKFAFDRS
jgi:hypothetical protein